MPRTYFQMISTSFHFPEKINDNNEYTENDDNKYFETKDKNIRIFENNSKKF